MLSASTAEITAASGTLVKSAILRRSSAGMSRSARHSRTSGWMPMERSSLTECWVGLVLISPEVLMYGTRVRCMKSAFSRPTSTRIWRMASRNGSDSMSPTVPPISTMAMSASSAPSRMLSLISSVMWGMTCTVRPR